jgi:hypothetical protein
MFFMQVCEKCDVWSMGVVMWEMWTLRVPFYDLSAQQILVGPCGMVVLFETELRCNMIND